MIVKWISISTGELNVVPLGNRLYKLGKDVSVRVRTDEGTFVYRFKKGFVTNFRSGGLFVDRFVDQIGDTITQVCWLIHDAAYTPCALLNGAHPISRKLADELLLACLLYADMGAVKAHVVYGSVRAFGNSAYEDDDELTESNAALFAFDWVDK